MKNTIAILGAGVLWGTMGIFSRVLSGFGLKPVHITAFRLVSATIVLIILSAFMGGKKNYKIKASDLKWFIMSGVLSIAGITICYFNSITLSSLSTAAILLYTAPVFVTIISYFVFNERITPMKVMALISAILGCVLVTGIDGKITAIGVLWGIGSGIAYALYSIFGTILLKRYSTFQVTLISFVIGTIAIIPFSDIAGIVKIVSAAENKILLISVCALSGIITAVLPYMLYTYGLKGTIPGKASIMASIEPVVATLNGIIFFNEPFGFTSFIGIAFVILAVMLINNFGRTSNNRNI